MPGLAVPLYSICAHLKQLGCGFVGTLEAGILVYFPPDCHLLYEPLGWMIPLWNLHYIQPWYPPNLYPSEVDPSTCIVSHDLMAISNGLVLIEDNSTDAPSQALVPPVLPSPGNPASEASTLQSVSTLLQSLHELVCSLTLGMPVPSMPLVPSPTTVPDSTAPPVFHPVLAFPLPCRARTLFAFFIMRVPLSWPSTLVTPLINLAPRLIGQQRNSIILWAVGNFKTINTHLLQVSRR